MARSGSDRREERIKFLETELHDRETEIALLKETADAVGSELQLDRVLELVAERAQRLIRAETLLIPILDEACSQYTYRAGCGKNADEIVGESLPLDLGICGWVWRHKRAWWRGVLDELDAEERNQWEQKAGTAILVPLIGKRHFLGGIGGINKIGGGDFDKRDLDLLSLFANQVAIAIENATFFTELDRAKHEAEAFQQELRTLNAELERRVAERTTQLAAVNKELRRLALYDALTGLASRSLILDRLQHAVDAGDREQRIFSILMLDLDHFKAVNDTLGHASGDELLRQVGARIKRALRKSDTVGRLGGDEFAVIIPGTNIENAVVVAEKIRGALAAPFALNGDAIHIAASLGIAHYPLHGRDTSTLLKCADVSMYHAKRTKSGWCVYDPQDHQAAATPGADRNWAVPS